MADLCKQLEDLIGTVPNPSVDQAALLALRDADPEARRLAERLHAKAAWRASPLRDLLPGLAIIDSSSLRYRLGARIANPLIRAGIDSWFTLATLTPAELSLVSGIGIEAVEEIVLAAAGEWATAYLHPVHKGRKAASIGRTGTPIELTMSKQILKLIGQAPDPVADRELLSALYDRNDANSCWLAEVFHTDDELRYSVLRQLLPGLGLVESSTFSIQLSVRAANSLGRMNADTLSALARMTPADILTLPGVGRAVGREILAAAISEWAASYLSQDEEKQAESHQGEGVSVQDGERRWRDLTRAFARIEHAAGFEVFRRRQLDPDNNPTQAEVAADLGISSQRVAQHERTIREMLSKQTRDNQSPFSDAVDDLRSRLGALAKRQESEDALAAIDPLERTMPESMPHRRALLLQLAGFRVCAGWVVDVETEGIFEALLKGLTETGPADLKVIDGQLARLGVRKELRLPWIASHPGFQIVDDELVRIKDK